MVEANKKLNLTRITEEQEAAEKHFLDSVALFLLWKGKGKVLDIGSGAGFPGMVLAVCNTDLSVTLLETVKKKSDFLVELREKLAAESVDVQWGRAEDYAHMSSYRAQFDLVTARAVASLAVLFELAGAFVRPGGHFIAYKGPSYQEELREAATAMSIMGLELVETRQVEFPRTERSVVLMDFLKVLDTPQQYPRKAGIPQKKPL